MILLLLLLSLARTHAPTLVGRSKHTRSAAATNRKVRSQSSRPPSSLSSASAADKRRRRRRTTHYQPIETDAKVESSVYLTTRAPKNRYAVQSRRFFESDRRRTGRRSIETKSYCRFSGVSVL